MAVVLLAAVLLGLAAGFGLVWHHERVHCSQIGELQVVVAALAEHVREHTYGPMPDEVAGYLAAAEAAAWEDQEEDP